MYVFIGIAEISSLKVPSIGHTQAEGSPLLPELLGPKATHGEASTKTGTFALAKGLCVDSIWLCVPIKCNTSEDYIRLTTITNDLFVKWIPIILWAHSIENETIPIDNTPVKLKVSQLALVFSPYI